MMFRRTSGAREPGMKDILLLVVIVAAWYLLQAYILPKMGVDT
jgi:hypothetical protein